MAQKKPRKVRTLADLKAAFADGTILRRYWVVCVDPGGVHLRYIGPNPDGYHPAKPVDLQLTTSPWELLAESMNMAGIPAEEA